jgi:hypothetical protein
MKELFAELKKIPKPVRIFLIRAVIIFVSWQLLYHLFLQKTGIPDQFLTNITAPHWF